MKGYVCVISWRRPGMDCRSPEAMDGEGFSPPCDLPAIADANIAL